MLQPDGFLGLQTKPGPQPQVRSDLGLNPGLEPGVLLGAAQVVTVRVVGGSVTGGSVTGGSVTVWVMKMVLAGMTLVTVVPG